MLPKPTKRVRAPKPLRRSRPIARRGAGQRRKRTPRAILDKRAGVKLADRLAAFLVRIRPTDDVHHLLSKKAHPSVRWDLDNLVSVSRDVHDTLQQSAAENEGFAVAVLGRERWEALKARSVTDLRERPADAVVRLRGEARRRGLTSQARELGLMGEEGA